MIGQQRLLIELQTLQGRFPRFSILVGAKGGGKKLLAQQLAKQLKAHLVTVETKAEPVREAVEMAYKQKSPILYLIPDADTMSNAAKNALLKVTEEPPRQAYFLMTLEDLGNTLDTLRSRGTVFYLDNYTAQELWVYANNSYDLNEQELEIITYVCDTPGEVDKVVGTNILGFYAFVEKVVGNIGKVSGANAFKIGDSLAFKDGDPGYDLAIFLRTVMYYYTKKALTSKENPLLFFKSVHVTSASLRDLRIRGINRRSLFDLWILDMRQIWRE